MLMARADPHCWKIGPPRQGPHTLYSNMTHRGKSRPVSLTVRRAVCFPAEARELKCGGFPKWLEPWSSSCGRGICDLEGVVSHIEYTKPEQIYQFPRCPLYDSCMISEATGEHWFCNEGEAQTAGWRKAEDCP